MNYLCVCVCVCVCVAEDSVYQDELDCANDETDFTVEEVANGKFQSSFPVAKYVSSLAFFL